MPLTDEEFKSDTHYELTEWGNWARGNRLSNTNVLSRMIQQRMDDIDSGRTGGDGFPLHIEVIDKSVAALKGESRNEHRVIKKYYLGRKSHLEIGNEMFRDPGWVRALHKRALASVARIKRGVKKSLTKAT